MRLERRAEGRAGVGCRNGTRSGWGKVLRASPIRDMPPERSLSDRYTLKGPTALGLDTP